MTLKDDAFPSSVAFENIHGALQADAAERKNAIKNGAAVFSFELKNKDGKTDSWHIDLKESGGVGRGKAPAGKEPDVTLALSDADFQKMVAGKAAPQQLFMAGKLKIRGNMMKATKMEPILKKAQTKAKL